MKSNFDFILITDRKQIVVTIWINFYAVDFSRFLHDLIKLGKHFYRPDRK
jgi:hypothetical protein